MGLGLPVWTCGYSCGLKNINLWVSLELTKSIRWHRKPVTIVFMKWIIHWTESSRFGGRKLGFIVFILAFIRVMGLTHFSAFFLRQFPIYILSVVLLDLLNHKVVVRTTCSISVYVYVIMYMKALCKLLGSTVVPPYPGGIRSKTPRGCLKPQLVPNSIYTMFFSYNYIPVIKF